MKVTINHIRCAYRHLYYEDGVHVPIIHLLKSVASRCHAQHKKAVLTGLADPKPHPVEPVK